MKKLLAIVLVLALFIPVFVIAEGETFSGTITMVCGTKDVDAMNEILLTYNELEDVGDVSIDYLVTQNVTDSETMMTSLIAADQLPDMFIGAVGATQQAYAANGYLVPLTEYGFADRLVDGDTELISWDGDFYSIPMMLSLSVVFLNKGTLDECGIVVDETNYPKNWSEFLALCDKLVEAGIENPIALAGQDSSSVTAWTFQYLYQVVYGENPNWYADILAGGKNGAAWNDESYMGMFEKYGEMLNYVADDVLGVTIDTLYERFITGEAPVVVFTAGVAANIWDIDPECEILMIPSCFTDDAEDQTLISGFDNGISITTGAVKSNHLELCVDLLDFVTTPEGSTIFNDATGYLPTIKGCQATIDPCYDIVFNILNNGLLPNSPTLSRQWIPGVKEIVKNGQQNWLAGEDAKTVADTIQEEHQRLMEGSPEWVENFLSTYVYK